MPYTYIGSGAYHEVYQQNDNVFKRRKGVPLIVCKNEEQLKELGSKSKEVETYLGLAFVWFFENNTAILSITDDEIEITHKETLRLLAPFVKNKIRAFECPLTIGTTTYAIRFGLPENERFSEGQCLYDATTNTVYQWIEGSFKPFDISLENQQALSNALFNTILNNPLIHTGTQAFDTFNQSMSNGTYDKLVEEMNSPSRTVALLTACNTIDIQPKEEDVPELGGRVVKAQFIQGNMPTDIELSLFVQRVYKDTGRILIDAFIKGNIIKTHLGLVCVDPNFALFSPKHCKPHQRRMSRTSDNYLNNRVEREIIEQFLEEKNHYPKTTDLIKQLIQANCPKPSHGFFKPQNSQPNDEQPRSLRSPHAYSF